METIGDWTECYNPSKQDKKSLLLLLLIINTILLIININLNYQCYYPSLDY